MTGGLALDAIKSRRFGMTDSIAYAAWAAFLAGKRVLIAGMDESVFLDRSDARGIWIAR